jgi:hypothetical protein
MDSFLRVKISRNRGDGRHVPILAPPLLVLGRVFPKNNSFRLQLPVHYFSTLIGYVRDEYLNVKIPTEQRKLPPADDEVTLQFTQIAPPENQQVITTTRASIRNANVVKPGPERTEVFTYGVQFNDLDPSHFTLLQNLTYEAMLVDRQKIVQGRHRRAQRQRPGRLRGRAFGSAQERRPCYITWLRRRLLVR